MVFVPERGFCSWQILRSCSSIAKLKCLLWALFCTASVPHLDDSSHAWGIYEGQNQEGASLQNWV